MFFKIIFLCVLAVSTADVCPETNGAFAAYLRHETNCNQFYECNWGQKVLFNCPAGLYFNTKLNVCDYPDNVECIKDEEIPDIDEPEVIESTCPETNGPLAAYLPHETDCSQFYECDWGNKILMSCPSGLYFNPKLNVCDYPVNVECGLKQQPDVEDPEVEEPEVEELNCPETNGILSEYLPHEKYCTLYYQCDWGRKILMYCSPGLYFNTKLNVCDYPTASGCVQK
ncbi:peritrophin-1-like [Onthophagus taurus]|uniref:peritrophin-1-like n=1 Tax=Onthophagus taurus TaxID=166361 RepID=UPI000C208A9C|nr:peritrophin-1-like [Onthophagus taurus]